MYSPILQFAADHPWLAVALSVPTSLVLVAFSWCSATLLSNSMTSLVALWSQTGALLLTLVRGYPPNIKWDKDVAPPSDDDVT